MADGGVVVMIIITLVLVLSTIGFLVYVWVQQEEEKERVGRALRRLRSTTNDLLKDDEEIRMEGAESGCAIDAVKDGLQDFKGEVAQGVSTDKVVLSSSAMLTTKTPTSEPKAPDRRPQVTGTGGTGGTGVTGSQSRGSVEEARCSEASSGR